MEGKRHDGQSDAIRLMKSQRLQRPGRRVASAERVSLAFQRVIAENSVKFSDLI